MLAHLIHEGGTLTDPHLGAGAAQDPSLRDRKFADSLLEGTRIRTIGPGASGEADAILPVKDRPR